MYFINKTWLLQLLYPQLIWKLPSTEKILYLTFDDGPHPTATAFVLDILKQFNAKATFFVIGKNVVANKDMYERILNEGHAVGNHTYQHLNGWKTSDEAYINDIIEAAEVVDSNLFRPPYGKITRFQAKALLGNTPKKRLSIPEKFQIIMWTVLSGDFDRTISKEKCLKNVLNNTKKSGSILVFHDSEKAFDNMSYALPMVLEHFSKKGFQFKAITNNTLK